MKYWKWVKTNNIIHASLGDLDLTRITEAQARQLLLERSQYLKITPDGLKKPLFAASEIAPLVKAATTSDEAVAFAALSDTQAVRNAMVKKLEELA